jgi:hypothetical protein
MKTLICTIFAGASTFAFAQDCSNYYYFQNNKTIEMTLYRKGKEDGKQIYTVSGLQSNGNSVTSTVNSELFNSSGKSVSKAMNTMQCKDGIMMMDMRMRFAKEQQKQIADANAKTENVYIEYPSTMKNGDALKDARIHMDLTVNGTAETIDMTVYNRKVAGTDTISSPAGKWSCFKITYQSKTEIKVMGIGIPVTLDGTEWYSPGFGTVKTESKYGGSLITKLN